MNRFRGSIRLRAHLQTLLLIELYVVNFAMVAFTSGLFLVTTDRIVNQRQARSFLENISSLPFPPQKAAAGVFLLFGLLLLVALWRRKGEGHWKPVLFSSIELAICIFIAYLLDFCYRGILLLPILGAVRFMENNRQKFGFSVVVLLCYMLLDTDVLSPGFDVLSLSDYIQYYNAQTRLWLFLCRNILVSLNEIFMLIFLLIMLEAQMAETNEIRVLYQTLSETAEELRVANMRLEEYAKQSEQLAQTRERNRIAREIHDTLGHTLTGISTGLDACLEMMNIDLDMTQKQMKRVAEAARSGLLDVRRSVNALRPDVLEEQSFRQALLKLAEETETLTQTKVELILPQELLLSSEQEETCFRIVQESITNAIRHGKAKCIRIVFEGDWKENTIDIRDDGIGCDTYQEGFGLRHMRERIEMLGGEIQIDGGNGFHSFVRFPVSQGKLGEPPRDNFKNGDEKNTQEQ